MLGTPDKREWPEGNRAKNLNYFFLVVLPLRVGGGIEQNAEKTTKPSWKNGDQFFTFYFFFYICTNVGGFMFYLSGLNIAHIIKPYRDPVHF